MKETDQDVAQLVQEIHEAVEMLIPDEMVEQYYFKALDSLPGTYRTGVGHLIVNVHPRSECERPCVVHFPLNGPWASWPTNYVVLTKRFYRICPHGVQHPAAEDLMRGIPGGHDVCCCDCGKELASDFGGN